MKYVQFHEARIALAAASMQRLAADGRSRSRVLNAISGASRERGDRREQLVGVTVARPT